MCARVIVIQGALPDLMRLLFSLDYIEICTPVGRRLLLRSVVLTMSLSLGKIKLLWENVEVRIILAVAGARTNCLLLVGTGLLYREGIDFGSCSMPIGTIFGALDFVYRGEIRLGRLDVLLKLRLFFVYIV
jgi:hypothetical protein